MEYWFWLDNGKSVWMPGARPELFLGAPRPKRRWINHDGERKTPGKWSVNFCVRQSSTVQLIILLDRWTSTHRTFCKKDKTTGRYFLKRPKDQFNYDGPGALWAWVYHPFHLGEQTLKYRSIAAPPSPVAIRVARSTLSKKDMIMTLYSLLQLNPTPTHQKNPRSSRLLPNGRTSKLSIVLPHLKILFLILGMNGTLVTQAT